MLNDFNKYDLFNLSFSGAVPKVCVFDRDTIYMIKSDSPNEYKCVSEYIAYKLACVLDIECQRVSLGYRDGLLSCGIELFGNGSSTIHHYYDVNDSSLDSFDNDVRELPYTLDFIISVLRKYKNVDINPNDLISNFVQMCLFDCLIGNYDRHWGNWGFIGYNKDYTICPLFDNGSSLYPKLSDLEIKDVLSNNSKFHEAIYEFPKSQIRRTKKKKYLYKDLMTRLLELGFHSEFESFINKFEKNINLVNSVFNDSDLFEVISVDRIKFLNFMVLFRFKYLIKDVFECN